MSWRIYKNFVLTPHRQLAVRRRLAMKQGINRDDFPILSTTPQMGKPLIYLDSGASSQKPVYVLDKMDEYYRTSHANVHRGAHVLAMRATDEYEGARRSVQKFINAQHREEIIFTRGATESINLVALSWGSFLQPGDEIVLSVMEHHSNLVPWQMVAKRTGAVLRFIQLDEQQGLDMQHFRSLLSPKTKLVAIVHASNVLGTINPIETIIKEAHQVGARVLVDACQSVPHLSIDVQALDVDFLVASSHKMCGPTGIGFLYGKLSLLESMPPVQGGGEMIDTVHLEYSTYARPPSRFEAGTPAIAEAVGLGAACEYLQTIGMDRIEAHERALGDYLYERLASREDFIVYGPPPSPERPRGSLVAFNHRKIHPTDLAFFLDNEGIALRSGHHCCQPLHRLLGVPGSLRASLYFYNGKDDVDNFLKKLDESVEIFEQLEE
eukprot:gene8050-8879_t